MMRPFSSVLKHKLPEQHSGVKERSTYQRFKKKRKEKKSHGREIQIVSCGFNFFSSNRERLPVAEFCSRMTHGAGNQVQELGRGKVVERWNLVAEDGEQRGVRSGERELVGGQSSPYVLFGAKASSISGTWALV